MSVKQPGWLACCFWGIFITSIILFIGKLCTDLLPLNLSQQMEQLLNDHVLLMVMIAYILGIFVFRRLGLHPLEEEDWL